MEALKILLEARSLCKNYKLHMSKDFGADNFTVKCAADFAGVRDFSLTLCAGECVGIAGVSGCGKSTAAKLLMGLQQADGGEIFLYDEDQTARKINFAEKLSAQKFYSNVQLIAQDAASTFHPLYSIGTALGDALKHAGYSKAERNAKITQLLTQVGLPQNYAARKIYELSGGEAQRTAIARALALSPKILICDEITSALDVIVQEQIIELLQNLQRAENLALIFISHDLGVIQKICDKIIIMEAGKIVEQGVLREIINAPQSNTAQRLVKLAQKFAL